MLYSARQMLFIKSSIIISLHDLFSFNAENIIFAPIRKTQLLSELRENKFLYLKSPPIYLTYCVHNWPLQSLNILLFSFYTSNDGLRIFSLKM